MVPHIAARRRPQVPIWRQRTVTNRFLPFNVTIILLISAVFSPGRAAVQTYVRQDTARATYEASLAAAAEGPELGAWYYIGPFDNTEGKGFATAYPPEKAIDLSAAYEGKAGRDVRWQVGHRFRDGDVNSLNLFEDNDNIVVYLYRTITAPEKQDVPVLLGSDDGIKAWLNGEEILANNASRACRLGDESAQLKLSKGENRLLLKVTQGGGPAGFAFAIDTGAETLLQSIARDFPAEINDLLIELDWVRQAQTRAASPGAAMAPEDDAPGACDGVKDGGTGFHTQREDGPWWRVDLGQEYPLREALLYNREDAGSRNHDLILSLSSDGETWEQIWQNDGTMFHGAVDGKPMVVDLGGKRARYVRLHIARSEFLHLDEVEVYGVDEPAKNLALSKVATQSSASPWSTYTPRRAAESAAMDAATFRPATAAALELAHKTLEFVAARRPLPEVAGKLAELFTRFNEAGADTDWKELYLDVRRLRREMILSHPLLDFDRLLVTKRPPTLYSHMVDQYEGRHSRPGPGLVLVSPWKSGARTENLLEGRLPVGAVLNPDLSYDGGRVLFSYCDHTVQDRNARCFYIHEYDLANRTVRQVTGVPGVDPMERWENRDSVAIEDFDPCYLPDGDILFISTRNQGFGRCHGGRYTPSYVLYRCDPEGTQFRRLSYGEANEWEPAVLHDGNIVYCRWDYINRHDTVLQSLWTTRPDGTAVAHYYGNSTRNPCMTNEPKAIPGSDRVACLAMAHHSYTAGSIITVDRNQGQEGADPIRRITPEVSFPETEGWPLSSYANPWPLSEDLYLAAFAPEPLASQGKVASEAAYGIYLIDTLGGRELVYRDPAVSCFSPIPVQPRPTPPVLPSSVDDSKNYGTFLIQDVYRSVEPLVQGTIRALRVVRLFDQPTASVPERGAVSQEIVKGVLGTVPIGEDGSAAFKAPAETPLLFQLVDDNDLAVFSMRSQVYLQPGEVMSCVGCHEARGETPGAYSRLSPETALEITPSAGPAYPGGLSFARTVQPILDRHCIGCHGLQARRADLCLLGSRTDNYSVAYESLVNRPGLLKLAHRNEQTDISTMLDYGGHAGRLARLLLEDHREKAPLDRDSFSRIARWLDLNGQYYGDYSFSRAERRNPSEDGVAALREHIKASCNGCHAGMSDQPLAALVNIALPTESRVLQAPLAREAGGWGQCQTAWGDTSADGYRAMLDRVLAATGPGE